MLCEIADNYFQSLNPLAERISDDIRNIKEAYEHLWQGLSATEKEQIINETIIHPEALLKYSITLQDIYGQSGCKFETGKKMIIDEHTGVSWCDEHSAPFSWKSKSLLELCNTSHCVSMVPNQTDKIRKLPPSADNGKLVTDEILSSADTTDSASYSGGPFSQFCAKLKSLPGKSYQVAQSFDEKGILTKIKENAVCKFQNTIKMMGNKMNSAPNSEGDVLFIGGGGAVIVPRTDKIGAVISKPTSPPPPPPPRVLLRKDQAETPLLEAAPNPKCDSSLVNDDLSLGSNDNIVPESANDGTDTVVPKSGFDFLDDW